MNGFIVGGDDYEDQLMQQSKLLKKRHRNKTELMQNAMMSYL